MGLKQIEAAVLAEARIKLRNRRLRQADIVAWSIGPASFTEPKGGEVVVEFRCEAVGADVRVVVAGAWCDKRREDEK